MEQEVLNIIIAVVVVLLTLVFFLIYRWGKTTKRTVLLTGISDSGKTLIFTRLVQNKFVHTHTSIKENSAEYTTTKDRTVQIVDIPGHERLRGKFLEQYKKNARAFIYVIDSLTLQKDVRDVADYLYTLLTDGETGKCRNVLIFCNKQDHATAKGIPVIKAVLEKELNTVRTTRTHSLQSTDGSDSGEIYLGIKDQEFDFAHLLPTVVSFAEGYALNKDNEAAKANLEPLIDWIGQIS
ncbi:signal recognition particle receptor subunit beta [Cimex lectularius]|uniref:Signal recognition particle receptor subunit beta n=1 Tax=Cimex lectularius TaxID=79782 RepID=A0A8I6SBF7_CIMLE|nr:signal recognition particle receptor subunit beta [Cimex lectularius]